MPASAVRTAAEDGTGRGPSHPDRRHRLARLVPAGVIGGGGIALLVATVVSNGSNLAFNVVMSRLLGPGRYGALGSIVGFLTVFTVLTSAAQLAVAQAVAGKLEQAAAGLRLRRPVVAAAAAGGAGLVLATVLSPVLEGFLHLASPGLVIVLGLVLAPTVAATVPVGVLLGRQRYVVVGASLVTGALGRVAVGVVLVEAGLGTGGALAGSVGGQLLAYAVVLWPLRRELRREHDAAPLSAHLGTAALSVVALSGLSAFTAVDSILARHFLPAATAGHYVAAATAARIAMFAPGAVALVVFPRFAALAPGERAERRLLAEALAVTTALSVGAAAVLMAVPHLAVAILFGSSYGPAVPLLRVLAIAGAALGVVGLLVYYHQARSSTVAACAWLGVVAAAVVISVGAHGSASAIAWTMVACTLGVAAVALVTAIWRPAAAPVALEIPGGPPVALGEAPDLDVTMVVPYYNPGPRFLPSLQELMAALKEAAVSFEVIAVSDGSTDGSADSLGDLAHNPDWLRRVELPTNQGKGAALRAGLAAGRGQYLGFIDADGDIPSMQVKQLVELVRTYRPDIVLGSKRHPLSEVRYPPLRRLLSWGYQQLVRVLFRLNVRDTQTGLKLVRREVLEQVLPRMLEKRFAFDLELLVVARRCGFRRFFEAPVNIQDRFSSTIGPASVWPMMLDTLAVFYRLRVLRYYDQVHEPVVAVSQRRPEAEDHARTSLAEVRISCES
jgi:O-antigen/teichoic acid export membrane protein